MWREEKEKLKKSESKGKMIHILARNLTWHSAIKRNYSKSEFKRRQ